MAKLFFTTDNKCNFIAKLITICFKQIWYTLEIIFSQIAMQNKKSLQIEACRQLSQILNTY